MIIKKRGIYKDIKIKIKNMKIMFKMNPKLIKLKASLPCK